MTKCFAEKRNVRTARADTARTYIRTYTGRNFICDKNVLENLIFRTRPLPPVKIKLSTILPGTCLICMSGRVTRLFAALDVTSTRDPFEIHFAQLWAAPISARLSKRRGRTLSPRNALTYIFTLNFGADQMTMLVPFIYFYFFFSLHENSITPKYIRAWGEKMTENSHTYLAADSHDGWRKPSKPLPVV